MKLQSNIDRVFLNKLWGIKSKERFNSLRIGTIFRQTGSSLIVGGEDGIIRIYDLPITNNTAQPQVLLESKGGAIQTMCIYDITKFYHKDLLVADSKGLLTVFCNKQILNRQTLSSDSINSLQIFQNSSSSEIITGTDTGIITASLLSAELWRINLNDFHKTEEASHLVSVTCMLVAELQDQSGVVKNYLLVADSAGMVHVINQATIVLSLKSPAVITGMVAGRFISNIQLGISGGDAMSTNKVCQQVALGAKTGAIYILHNFAITLDEFANCKCPITQLSVVEMADRESDLLLCCGHINYLFIFQEGKVLCKYETSDWINTLDIGDINNDGETEVVIGCLDNTITALKLTF